MPRNHVIKYSFKEIFQLYENLIPQKEGGLVVLWLAKQIQDQEIDKHFSRKNIEQGMKEVSQLGPNGLPQTERILRNLLNYYNENQWIIEESNDLIEMLCNIESCKNC